MSRTNSSVDGPKTLDSAVSRLLKRRRWTGSWELFDQRLTRKASWELFHGRANSEFAATTHVDIDGKPWWVTATYGTKGNVENILTLGLAIGGLTLRTKLNLRISNIDPRELPIPSKTYPDSSCKHAQEYVGSHDELMRFVKRYS